MSCLSHRRYLRNVWFNSYSRSRQWSKRVQWKYLANISETPYLICRWTQVNKSFNFILFAFQVLSEKRQYQSSLSLLCIAIYKYMPIRDTLTGYFTMLQPNSIHMYTQHTYKQDIPHTPRITPHNQTCIHHTHHIPLTHIHTHTPHNNLKQRATYYYK